MKARLLLVPLFAAITVMFVAAAVIATPAAEAATKPCAASKLVVRAGEEPGGGAAGSVRYRVEYSRSERPSRSPQLRLARQVGVSRVKPTPWATARSR
jgi:hypothetical protein